MEITSPNLLSRGFFPDHTELQEHTLVTDSDIVVGDRCQIEYGLTGECVAVCEFSRLMGNVTAHGELRVDNFCQIQGDVTAEENAFLGEGVHIKGKLTVHGDMDIGDNVQIDRGFEAKGWIVIRNPMPVIVYLLLYLMALLKFEREEELQKFLDQMSGEDAEPETPLLIPSRTQLSMEGLTFQTPLTIGAHNRLQSTPPYLAVSAVPGSYRSEKIPSFTERSSAVKLSAWPAGPQFWETCSPPPWSFMRRPGSRV
jgi:predicted acyltransferase (DUF342 family)